MLQQDKPDDYVIATGHTHSVREFCKKAFGYAGMNYEDFVVVDPIFYRPAETDLLTGNADKAKNSLGWKQTIRFDDLIREMVEADMKSL